MLKICIQAGHENISSNCDASLRSGTGAGGEVGVNIAVRDAVALLLQNKGIQVQKVNANYNCDPGSLDTDWDLFLALHCDMDYPGDMGSGFCDFPEPSTDASTLESQRLAKAIQGSFFSTVGIAIKSRSNANTRFYYMWNSLSPKTPCVLIEMGQVKDPHDSVILQNTSKVALALSNAILIALGVDNALPSAIGNTQIEELQKELDDMRLSRDRWKRDFKDLESLHMTLKTDLAKAQADLLLAQQTIEKLKEAIQTNKTPLSFYTWQERFKSLFS